MWIAFAAVFIAGVLVSRMSKNEMVSESEQGLLDH